jgi:hypothetical protein
LAIDELLDEAVFAKHESVALGAVSGLARGLMDPATSDLFEQRALGFGSARFAVELDVGHDSFLAYDGICGVGL